MNKYIIMSSAIPVSDHAESGVMLVDDDLPEVVPDIPSDDADDVEDADIAALATNIDDQISSPQIPEHNDDDSMTDMDIPDIPDIRDRDDEEPPSAPATSPSQPNPLEMSSAPLFLLSNNKKENKKRSSSNGNDMSSHPLFSAAATTNGSGGVDTTNRKDIRENILGFSEGEKVFLLRQPSGHTEYAQHKVMRILYRPHMPNVTSGYVVAVKSDADGKLRWRDSDLMLPVVSE